MTAHLVTVFWGVGRRGVAADATALDRLLDIAHQEAVRDGRPLSVDLVRDDAAGTLSVVVGSERSTLRHVPDDGEPPYRSSVGWLGGDEPFVFSVAGEETSVAARDTIPTATACAAARYFLATGKLAPTMRWTTS